MDRIHLAWPGTPAVSTARGSRATPSPGRPDRAGRLSQDHTCHHAIHPEGHAPPTQALDRPARPMTTPRRDGAPATPRGKQPINFLSQSLSKRSPAMVYCRLEALSTCQRLCGGRRANGDRVVLGWRASAGRLTSWSAGPFRVARLNEIFSPTGLLLCYNAGVAIDLLCLCGGRPTARKATAQGATSYTFGPVSITMGGDQWHWPALVKAPW